MIPRTVTLYWEGPRYDYVDLACDQWRTLYPDFDVTLFTPQSARESLAAKPLGHPTVSSEDAVAMFDSSRIAAMRADVFRMAYLYREGGVWCDISFSPRKVMPQIENLGSTAIFWQRDVGTTPNSFFVVPPKSPTMDVMLRNAAVHFKTLESNNVFVATGPKVMTDLLQSEPDEFDYEILGSRDVQQEYFKLPRRPAHKQKGRHWSKRQQNETIYRTYFGPTRHLELRLFANQGGSDCQISGVRADQTDIPQALIAFASQCPTHLDTPQKRYGLFETPSFIALRRAFDAWLMGDAKTQSVSNQKGQSQASAGSSVVLNLESIVGQPWGDIWSSVLQANYFFRGLREILRDHKVTLTLPKTAPSDSDDLDQACANGFVRAVEQACRSEFDYSAPD